MFYIFLRDSFIGRTIYHLSGRKLFTHREEQKDYIIPEKYLAKEQVVTEEASGSESEKTVTSSKIYVTWDGDDDIENPKNWPLYLKAFFTFQICLLTTSVYMASAIYSPGIEILMEEMGITRVKATLPLTMFVIGYGLGPMFFSPLSENAAFGRTYIYIFTLFIFFVLQIPISLVNDIASLSVLRFIAGFFASPALATGAASVDDISHPAYLPLMIAVWSISCVCGPSLGPLFGSILIVKRDWHWTFWLVCMSSGISLVVLSFFLPESFEKTLLYRKARRLRKLTGNQNITCEGEKENEGLVFQEVIVKTLWRPIEITLFEPIVLAINLYIALVYSILYLWFEAFPLVYIQIYQFATIPSGVSFLSVIVGVLLAAFFYLVYLDKTYTRKVLAGSPIYPEFFLPVMIVGAILMPIGLFIFGWTSTASAHWIGSMVGSVIFNASAFFLFQSCLNYLAGSFYFYLASVFAGNTLFRSVIAGCFPLFANALFNNTASGKFPVGWGASILGFISVAMILIPVVFFWKGPQLRARSKWSSL